MNAVLMTFVMLSSAAIGGEYVMSAYRGRDDHENLWSGVKLGVGILLIYLSIQMSFK